MAITYTAEDAINLISRQVPRMVESDSAAYMINLGLYEIWKKYDWRESLSKFTPFYLIPNEQDHGPPAVTVPSDFLGLRSAYIVRLNATPAFRERLQPIKDLELTYVRGFPTCIGYQPSTTSFRVFPRVPENIGAPDWCIQGEYKKRPIKITPSTIASTLLPFDDIFIFAMTEMIKWAGWAISGDPRAEKQYILAHALVDQMASSEGLDLGDVIIAPAESLAITSKNWMGSSWNRIF